MKSLTEQIQLFLDAPAFAVAGASNDRNKFGNKVLHCLIAHKKCVYAINPHETSIENLPCYANIQALPTEVSSLSIVTPPSVTTALVAEAIAYSIKNIWLQPGAESPTAIALAQAANINLIAGGPCILVELANK